MMRLKIWSLKKEVIQPIKLFILSIFDFLTLGQAFCSAQLSWLKLI